MLADFSSYSAGLSQTDSINDLSDSVIAIDADFYLDQLLGTKAPEPLLSALGGLPFSLQTHLNSELDVFQEHNITPLFIFHGLRAGQNYEPFRESDEAARSNGVAWESYNQHEANKAVQTFGNSRPPTSHFHRMLQKFLRERKLNFYVAPSSAWAQIAHFAQSRGEYFDVAMASSELLLFGVDRVITKFNVIQNEYQFVKKSDCIHRFGLATDDQWISANLLAGCVYLPTLPHIMKQGRRVNKLKIDEAADLLRTHGNAGINVCLHFQDDPEMKRLDYVDKYKRATLIIKHHYICAQAGQVQPFDLENAPSDIHLVIAQRLPDELYWYLFRGMIGTSALDQLQSGHIYELCPLDGGQAEAFRTLVSEKLRPVKASTLSLLAQPLARAYQHREVKHATWFDPVNEISIRLSDHVPPQELLSTWNVDEKVLGEIFSSDQAHVTLKGVVGALADGNKAPKTITSKPDPSALLSSKSELMANTFFRFLHLRGYTTNDHRLTPWGEVLNAALSNVPDKYSANLHESAFLAVELLRFDLLTSDDIFQFYAEADLKGNATDKRNNVLLSRIACLARLQHKPIGFTGPLSRQLLGYGCVAEAVRTSLRDMVEVCMTTMFLNGTAQRERTDWSDLGLELPFLLPTDCALGISVKHYLDNLLDPAAGVTGASKDATKDKGERKPTSPAQREEAKKSTPEYWVRHSKDFVGDLEMAFCLWDAVYAGAAVAHEKKLLKDGSKKRWEDIDAWVQARR